LVDDEDDDVEVEFDPPRGEHMGDSEEELIVCCSPEPDNPSVVNRMAEMGGRLGSWTTSLSHM
jgi:hypothetical protein